MSLELSYKGLSDQIGVISPNLIRNPFFVADPTATTLPSGWTSGASSVILSPVYSTENALDGKSLVISGSGYIKCDDFIKISGGNEMLGLYQSPLNFTVSVFLKGLETGEVAPTSGLKVEFFDDTDTLISSKTTYFGYTSDFGLKTAVISLDDTDFDTDYKLKVKLTNLSPTKTIYVKLLSFTPGDVAPSFFLPSSLTEETLNSIKNKTLTLTSGGTTLTYDGSTAKSLSVVSSITSSSGLSANSAASGAITLTNTGVTSLIGTASQVLVNGGTSAQTGAVTLTTPQSIGTTSNVTFGSVIATSGVSSTNGTFKARTGNVTGTHWTTHGWGKIGLASGSGAPSSGEATNPSAGDFFLRY